MTNERFSITRCAPEHTIGTIGTPALIAIITAPFLNSCRRLSGLRVPLGEIKNDCPALSASVAFSTLEIADPRALRLTGMNCAAKKACPTIGHLKSDSFRRMAILRGMAPTTAGASAELV